MFQNEVKILRFFEHNMKRQKVFTKGKTKMMRHKKIYRDDLVFQLKLPLGETDRVFGCALQQSEVNTFNSFFVRTPRAAPRPRWGGCYPIRNPNPLRRGPQPPSVQACLGPVAECREVQDFEVST